ncbi:MAG: MATE family efflux transporter [Lachnospiraceae bacterium]|nr:MATE family efflux transporter [Lachnospiraceae bacterium]
MKELRKIWGLTWPAIVEFALQTIVQYIDLYMVGKLGNDATAIVGLGSQVQFMLKFPIMSMSVGVLSSVAIAYGEKNDEHIHKMSVQTVNYTLTVGVLFWIISFIVGYVTVFVCNLEPELKKEFLAYFNISYSTTILFTATCMFGSVLKGIGDMKTPMVVNGFVNIINIAINYIMIYDTRYIIFFGKKVKVYGLGMGVRGAGLGTAISIGIGGILMIVAVYRNVYTSFKGYSKKPDIDIIKKFFFIGLPAGLASFVTGIGRMIFTSFVSSIGTVAMAAHFIAFTAESFFYIPAVGAEKGVTTLAGNYYGEGDINKIKKMSETGVAMTVFIMSLMGVFLYVLSDYVSALFSNETEVIGLSAQMLRIVAFSEPIFGLSLVLQGILEGLGRTKETFIGSSVPMWIFRVFICYFLIIELGLGLEFVWFCMIGDNVFRTILMYISLKKNNIRL